MHKKIESELVSLAHSLLQMKNKEDVLALKEKAGEIHEKLSVLAFLDRYVQVTPEAVKEEILEKMDSLDSIVKEEVVIEVEEEVIASVKELEEKPKESRKKKKKTKKEKKEKIKEVEVLQQKEEPLVEEGLFARKSEEKVLVATKNTLEEELKDTISLDVTTDLFENAVRLDAPKKSLNDVFVRKNLQIGLNDRIAFVKHLFDGSQEDFNRVVSQLNSFKNEKEAIKFVTKMVKLDYDWSGKEEYEERFITLITRKFA